MTKLDNIFNKLAKLIDPITRYSKIFLFISSYLFISFYYHSRYLENEKLKEKQRNIEKDENLEKKSTFFKRASKVTGGCVVISSILYGTRKIAEWNNHR